jgi:hypothetical protein
MPIWRGTTSTDWNTASNWVIDGSGNTGVPTSTTDAIFDSLSVNPCVMGASRNCRDLTFTAFPSTLTVATFNLNVFRNIVFQANQSSRIIGTTGTLVCNANSSITSNLGTWPLNYSIANVTNITMTLVDDMRVAGSYTVSGGVRIFNGNILYIGGNVTSSSIHGGTTNLVMNGSGTYSTSGGQLWNLEVNTTGSIIITGTVTFTRRFIITAAGSITMTAANVGITDTTTVNLGGRTIGNLTHNFNAGSQIVTYLTDVVCGNFTIGNGTNTYNGPGKIFAFGNYTVSAGAGIGSLVVELKGTGTISTGIMYLVTILNSSGTYTLGASLQISNNFTCQTLTLNTATSTVTVTSGVILNTLGINWYNITIPTGATITINQLLSISNNLTLSGTNTFAGTAGWTCANLLCSTISSVIILQNSVTYTTTTSVNMLATAANPITMRSNTPTVTRAIWTLNHTATQSIVYVNSQGVDSNAGQTVWTFGGVITTALVPLNWNVGLKPPSLGFIGI